MLPDDRAAEGKNPVLAVLNGVATLCCGILIVVLCRYRLRRLSLVRINQIQLQPGNIRIRFSAIDMLEAWIFDTAILARFRVNDPDNESRTSEAPPEIQRNSAATFLQNAVFRRGLVRNLLEEEPYQFASEHPEPLDALHAALAEQEISAAGTSVYTEVFDEFLVEPLSVLLAIASDWDGESVPGSGEDTDWDTITDQTSDDGSSVYAQA